MFTLPDFNLTCGIYTSGAAGIFTGKVYRGPSLCQLRGYGPRVVFASGNFVGASPISSEWCVLFPPLTDVRDAGCTANFTDFLELPAGSGRWYVVVYVDDVAKGFANEYRRVVVWKAFANTVYPDWPVWPTPIP